MGFFHYPYFVSVYISHLTCPRSCIFCLLVISSVNWFALTFVIVLVRARRTVILMSSCSVEHVQNALRCLSWSIVYILLYLPCDSFLFSSLKQKNLFFFVLTLRMQLITFPSINEAYCGSNNKGFITQTFKMLKKM